MKIAVYYYTRSGNTKKLAEAVAAAVDVQAADLSAPLSEKVDVLFLGSSPYAFDLDPAVREFIEKNHEKIGTLVCFGTSASGMSTFKKIKALAEEKHFTMFDEYYNCPGHFLLLHNGRPNASDCAAAAAFARETCEKLKAE